MSQPMITHRKQILPNGLRVIVIPTPGLHTAMLALYVRIGSRHEDATTNGVSHFLEHMFFRGSTGWPDTVGMNSAVESAGGNLNGITTRDHGCYFTPIHPGEVETGISILADMMQRPLLKDLDVEREIILEEMLDEVDSDGRDIDSDNLAKRACYGPHSLAFKIAGTRETVKALTLDAVRAHHARHYHAGNLVLAVAGAIDENQTIDLAARHFGGMRGGELTRDDPAPLWPSASHFELVKHEDAQLEFNLAFPCPPESHRDYAAQLCIRRLLDDGLSSRLPFEVVEKRGLAYSLHAGMDTFVDAGMFEIEGACAPGKAHKVVSEVFRVLEALAEKPVPMDELSRVQRRHRMSLVFAQDSVAELAGWFGAGEVLHVPESFEARCARVEAVTPADVQRVAQETFDRRRVIAICVGPGGERRRKEIARAIAG